MTYPVLSVFDFGAKLLATGDLDPVYGALTKMTWPDPFSQHKQLRRWLLSYWMFYDCGLASYLSEFEGSEYWEMVYTAAENIESTPEGLGRWPRGKERRHFRGMLAIKTVNALKQRWSNPEFMVNYVSLSEEEPCLTLKEVSARVQEHYGFGPWIGFKAADMIERVLGISVSFPDAEVMMFKDPTKAALMLWGLWRQEGFIPVDELDRMRDEDGNMSVDKSTRVRYVANRLIKHFSQVTAPPRFDRPVNIQEVETILCKWKSHSHGKYPLGNDLHEIRCGATPWAEVSPTAKAFVEALPQFE